MLSFQRKCLGFSLVVSVIASTSLHILGASQPQPTQSGAPLAARLATSKPGDVFVVSSAGFGYWAFTASDVKSTVQSILTLRKGARVAQAYIPSQFYSRLEIVQELLLNKGLQVSPERVISGDVPRLTILGNWRHEGKGNGDPGISGLVGQTTNELALKVEEILFPN